MRIRILDPDWKKIDPDPGNFFKIYWFVCFIFFAIFILQLDETLGSGSVDPYIFADPDPGSQNLADPTDPKHLKNIKIKHGFLEIVRK